MYTKYYSFAGCTVRLDSDTPVYDSDMFADFRCANASEVQMKINIVHSELPGKAGKLLFSDDTSSCYVRDGKGYYYTSYPVYGGMKQLGCRVTDDDSVTLYIVPGHRLWDSLVAFAVNYTQLLFRMGTATMHCSCIDVNGEAILFAGDKGAGKSTQAMLWNTFRNAEIINGDRIALKANADGVTAYGIPFCGSSKIALNKSLKVRAVILPGKAEKNTLTRLDGINAFMSVLGNLTYNTEDDVQMRNAIDTAQHIAAQIPVYSLMCVPDESSVKITEERLCLI